MLCIHKTSFSLSFNETKFSITKETLLRKMFHYYLFHGKWFRMPPLICFKRKILSLYVINENHFLLLKRKSWSIKKSSDSWIYLSHLDALSCLLILRLKIWFLIMECDSTIEIHLKLN